MCLSPGQGDVQKQHVQLSAMLLKGSACPVFAFCSFPWAEMQAVVHTPVSIASGCGGSVRWRQSGSHPHDCFRRDRLLFCSRHCYFRFSVTTAELTS